MYYHETFLQSIARFYAIKVELFEDVIRKTIEQNQILTQTEVNLDRFEKMMEEKEVLMEKLKIVDEDVSALFQTGSGVINKVLESEQENIELVKVQLDKLRGIGERLSEMENSNLRLYNNYVKSKAQIIQSFRQAKTAAGRYSQNMKNTHQNDMSYFLDRKK